ncbi:MAG TPA: beta-galactosidase [Ktedonosporobacter sp.]|nr:beta-galactosidase [Ktedonosporobacter sp.]
MDNTRKIIAIVCAAMAVLLVIGAGAFLYLNSNQKNRGSSGPGSQPTTTSNSTPSTVTTTSTGFKGIFVFDNKNSTDHVTDPSIVGTYLGYYWSQLEPQKGQYNWNIIDQDMKPWIDNGKHVTIRISTAGWKSWQPPYSGNGTPQWVYAQGVSSVTETDGAIFPQYWNPTFQQDLSDFVHAFASRYDGNAHISFIEIGVGSGGETKVDTRNNNPQRLQLWQAIGYTDQLWFDTIKQILSMYSSSFHRTPLVVMPDDSFIGKSKGFGETLLINYVISQHLWLQDNGLYTNSAVPDNWKQVPIVAEQRNRTSVSGDSLQDDLQAGLNEGATYLMVFSSDITPANQSALQQVATKAQP